MLYRKHSLTWRRVHSQLPHDFVPTLPILTSTTNPLLRRPLPLQELLLLKPTLAQIDEEQQEQETRQTQSEEEIEGRAVVLRSTGIDDSRRDERADERRSLADDAEQAEEKEFFAAGRHFGDHDLAVAVPGADEEAVEGLVEPDWVAIVNVRFFFWLQRARC